jgi:hypothetical protein
MFMDPTLIDGILGQIIQYAMCLEWLCGDRGIHKLYIRVFKNIGIYYLHELSLRIFYKKIGSNGSARH